MWQVPPVIKFLKGKFILEKATCGMQARHFSPVCTCGPLLCPDLSVMELHPAGQIVLQFTTGRDEYESETVVSLSPVLSQTVTNHRLKKMDQEPFL